MNQSMSVRATQASGGDLYGRAAAHLLLAAICMASSLIQITAGQTAAVLFPEGTVGGVRNHCHAPIHSAAALPYRPLPPPYN